MNGVTQSPADSPAPAAPTASRLVRVCRVLLPCWIVFLCLVPDPRALGAAQFAVDAVRGVLGIGEAGARALATLSLRIAGVALLGALLMVAFGGRRWERRSALMLLLAPLVALVTLWINHGHFPIWVQSQLAIVAAVIGGITGMAVLGSRSAIAVAVAAIAALLAWGTATGIEDELDAAARRVGLHVLSRAAADADGDRAFVQLVEIAFAQARDDAGGADPVFANRAAVLALGVILGEEKIARVAGRLFDERRLPEIEALRKRVTLYGRKDWPQHFWVSAALTVLSDEDRSIAVGIVKELMDATSGGTGFSFCDLAADAAGNRFALAATRDAESALALQQRITGGLTAPDVFPDVRDLPEGLTREAFQDQYGGLGGEGTAKVVDEIRRRLDSCAALR